MDKVDERCRFERRARRRFSHMKEARPSQLTGRVFGLGTVAAGATSGALPVELRR